MGFSERSGGARSNMSVANKIQTYWPVFVAIVLAVVWLTSTALSASLSVAKVEAGVASNKEAVDKAVDKTDDHQKTITTVSERLSAVETEVKHIRINQSENHKDIKSELKILRRDIKKALAK
tara:strand:- start:3168 stop:3533 length:366 start_codon:yes stop_codon:yes gene_type:complete